MWNKLRGIRNLTLIIVLINFLSLLWIWVSSKVSNISFSYLIELGLDTVQIQEIIKHSQASYKATTLPIVALNFISLFVLLFILITAKTKRNGSN